MRRLLFALLLALPSVALATPRTLPFTYPYATLPRGGRELEQYVDITPVRTLDMTGATVYTTRSILTTELEYGLLDRLELGLYLQLSDDPGSGTGDSPLHMDGVKQRLRLRLAEAGEWPVDVSLYGEIAELRTEFEVEGKLMFERQLGRLRLLTNLWAEYEMYYAGRREWVLRPTAGASFEVTPALHLGLEYWMYGEYGGGAPASAFNPSLHQYAGPTVHVHLDRLWFVVAPYLRFDSWSRPSEIGDQFGRVWVRAIVGIDL